MECSTYAPVSGQNVTCHVFLRNKADTLLTELNTDSFTSVYISNKGASLSAYPVDSEQGDATFSFLFTALQPGALRLRVGVTQQSEEGFVGNADEYGWMFMTVELGDLAIETSTLECLTGPTVEAGITFVCNINGRDSFYNRQGVEDDAGGLEIVAELVGQNQTQLLFTIAWSSFAVFSSEMTILTTGTW